MDVISIISFVNETISFANDLHSRWETSKGNKDALDELIIEQRTLLERLKEIKNKFETTQELFEAFNADDKKEITVDFKQIKSDCMNTRIKLKGIENKK